MSDIIFVLSKLFSVYIKSLYFIVIIYQGPLYYYGLTWIPAWMSNHIPNRVLDEITNPVEVLEWISTVISHFIMDVNYLSMLGLKLKHVIVKGAPAV